MILVEIALMFVSLCCALGFIILVIAMVSSDLDGNDKSQCFLALVASILIGFTTAKSVVYLKDYNVISSKLQTELTKCEKDLPRTNECVMIAVPKQKGDKDAKEIQDNVSK